jgi:tetratricopeptide (TPR) repeat protein
MRTLGPCIALAALVAISADGFGHLASADPKVDRADELFAEGKALLESNLLQACAKFDESLRYNPAAIGTLLNVALCDEKLGRLASAVAKFSEARDRAQEQGLTQHVLAAEQHITTLEPDVPHLTIRLTESLPDTKVLVDNRLVLLDALTSIAMDPGERVIVVSAPDRLPYRNQLIIGKAEHKEIIIPALARSVTIRSSQRRIGQLLTLTGSAALGTGIGLGLYARNLYHKQFGHTDPGDGLCTTDAVCEPTGQKQTQRARTLGNVATAIGGAGIVVAAIGAYLWYRAPQSTAHDTSDKKVAVVPDLSLTRFGITALGRF